jgi:diguanylate cyclase (GGDEF)-like protein
LAIAASLLLGGLVWLGDYLTNELMNFTALYLIPVGLITWRAGRLPGVLLSVGCIAAWALSEYGVNDGWRVSAIPWWNAAERLGILVLVVCVLGGLKRSLERERELARTDPVTGAANRRSFAEAARWEIERARRYGHPFAVAYIDFDDFKAVNDRQGHGAGDAALLAAAGVMLGELRAPDLVARMGGDEFAVLMPETGGAVAGEAVERLRARLLSAMREGGWPVTFSIGLACFEQAPASVDELIRRADDLMYQAKKNGKDAIRREVYGS